MKVLTNLSLCVAVFGALTIGAASAYTGHALARHAKIGMAQATQIAMKARPGKIMDRELEREAGGSGLRYSFDIKAGSATHEVGVDALTGKVLEDSIEGPNAD